LRPKPDLEDDTLISFRQEAQDLRTEILSRWGGPDNIDVLDVLNITNSARNVLKERFKQKIHDDLNHVLKIVFTGTSITAAHDCFFNQSYPLVFERTMKSLFQAAGIDLQVFNVAQGNSPVYPATWCVGATAGEDADIIGWEHTLNCPSSTSQCIEDFIRRIAQFPSNPIPIAFHALAKPKMIGKLKKLSDLMFNGPNGNETLFDRYSEFGFHAVLVVNALATNSKLPEFSEQHLIWDGKIGTKNWHPGPWGHQLAADILSFSYISILEEAFRESYKPRKVQFVTLPRPLFQTIDLMPLKVQCWTSFRPIIKKTDSLVEKVTPSISVHSNVSNEFIIEAVNMKGNVSTIIDHSSWNHFLWPTDFWPVYLGITNDWGMLDRKYALVGCNDSLDARFDLEFSNSGPLAICEPAPTKRGYPEGYAHLGVSSNITVDGQRFEFYSVYPFPCLISSSDYSAGFHSLSIKNANSSCIGISHLVIP
jgi:hypothetical protein